LACLHPSKGATALQDTSALTKSPIFNQLLPADGIHSARTASHGTGLATKTQIVAISLLSYSQGMNDKSQRVAGIFIAPRYADWAVAVFGWLGARRVGRHFRDWAFRRRCWRFVVCLGLVLSRRSHFDLAQLNAC
jgi:hypothetical protein